jgi:hypothetical protein
MLATWLFCPNGIAANQILENLAKKEFGDKIKINSTYVELKNSVIRELKNMKHDEFEENRLDALIGAEHLKQNDFSNFVSVRFAYWGLMITVMLTIIGENPIYTYFNMSKYNFGKLVAVILTVILISMSRMIHMQHDQLQYFSFKMICFDEILKNRDMHEQDNYMKSKRK